MNEERAKALRAQIWALFDQHGGRMTLLELYRLVMQAEVFGRTDPELRRRFDEEGVQALHDPLVVVRLQQAIEADLADFEETE
jgi:hypothetical protein